jgi:hypothetical protein
MNKMMFGTLTKRSGFSEPFSIAVADSPVMHISKSNEAGLGEQG